MAAIQLYSSPVITIQTILVILLLSVSLNNKLRLKE